eukprot:2026239-Rhodomonas_salina.2
MHRINNYYEIITTRTTRKRDHLDQQIHITAHTPCICVRHVLDLLTLDEATKLAVVEAFEYAQPLPPLLVEDVDRSTWAQWLLENEGTEANGGESATGEGERRANLAAAKEGRGEGEMSGEGEKEEGRVGKERTWKVRRARVRF